MNDIERATLVKIYEILTSGRTHEARLMLAKYLKLDEFELT